MEKFTLFLARQNAIYRSPFYWNSQTSYENSLLSIHRQKAALHIEDYGQLNLVILARWFAALCLGLCQRCSELFDNEQNNQRK